MKIEINDKVYRVQILMGSQIVQLWYPAYPFVREYEINMVDMVDLRSKLTEDNWTATAYNGVTRYDRKEQVS